MEIAPIAGLRAIPAVKPRPAYAELTALFALEAAAEAGDDTWTGGGKKAAGAEEDEEEVDEPKEDEDGWQEDAIPARLSASSGGQISFFV